MDDEQLNSTRRRPPGAPDETMPLAVNPAPPDLLIPAQVAAWAEIPVTVVCDALMGAQGMDAAIRPVADQAAFAGLALTARTNQGGNTALHYAMDVAWPGAVLVVETGGWEANAVWGGVSTRGAKSRGFTGVVVDGYVRDLAMIRNSGLPVFARGLSPNAPHREVGGEVNVPITCGGVPVLPGDLVLGDEDGVVVAPPDQLAGLMERCRARMAQRQEFLREIGGKGATSGTWNLPDPDRS